MHSIGRLRLFKNLRLINIIALSQISRYFLSCKKALLTNMNTFIQNRQTSVNSRKKHLKILKMLKLMIKLNMKKISTNKCSVHVLKVNKSRIKCFWFMTSLTKMQKGIPYLLKKDLKNLIQNGVKY
jgi:hypothetical protein